MVHMGITVLPRVLITRPVHVMSICGEQQGSVCGGGRLLGHQVITQDSTGLRIRVVIHKFCPHKPVVNAEDAYSFPKSCLSLVIEAEGDREHIVDLDGMSPQGAEP